MVKSYASGELDEHYALINRSSKFSFYLLLLIVLPVAFNLDALLNVWLVEVPQYTKEFCIYIMIAYLVDAIGAPLEISVFANGNIKGLQVISALVFLLGIIVSFILLKMGMVPYVVSIVTLAIHIVTFLITLYYAHKLSQVGVLKFIKSVMFPVLTVGGLSIIVPFFLKKYSIGFWHAVLLCVADIIWEILVIWVVGLEKSEKTYIKNTIITKLHLSR